MLTIIRSKMIGLIMILSYHQEVCHATDFPANDNTNVYRPTRINNKIFIPKKTTVRSPVEQGTTLETHRSVLHSPTTNVDATPLGRYSAGDHLGPKLQVQPTGNQ